MNTNDEVELLEVPGRQYLMIDGSGDPNASQAYADAVEALFATAYALKFACKRSGVEFAVSPLEGLWSADGPAPRFARNLRAQRIPFHCLQQPAHLRGHVDLPVSPLWRPVQHVAIQCRPRGLPPAPDLARVEAPRATCRRSQESSRPDSTAACFNVARPR